MALSSRNSAFWRRSSFSRLSRLLPAPGRDSAARGLWRSRFDGFVGVACGAHMLWRGGARRKGSCLLRPVENIEDCGDKQRRRFSGTGAAAEKSDGSDRAADVKMQRFDDGRRIETEIRGNIGEPLRAASLGPGKKAGKAGKIFCTAQIQQAFAGENRRVWMRRILATHRHDWHMGRKPGRQNGQSVRDVLVAQARRAAKPGHAALSFLCKHG